MVCYHQNLIRRTLGLTLSKSTIIKLRPVVYDNGVRNFELTYNVSPYKLCHVFVFDVSIGLNFHPLAEIVCGYEQELF